MRTESGESTALEDTSLLVLSCDSYSDAWEPFFFFFFRFWPACPFPVYLVSNHLSYPDDRVRMLHIEDPKTDWSTGFLWAVSRIPSGNVIVCMEDYFLSAPVQEQTVVALIQYARHRDAGYLRFVPIPPPDAPCADNPLLGEIHKGSPYRSANQAAWWKKEVLQHVLKAGEDPWEFEKYGAARSCQRDEAFLALRENVGYPLDYYTTAIRKGMWEPGAVAMCEQYGIRLDFKRRKVMTRYSQWQRSFNAKVKHPVKQWLRRWIGKK